MAKDARKRFSPEQIRRILHDAAGNNTIMEVCARHDVTENTIYRWRRRFPQLLRSLERTRPAENIF